MTLRLRPRTVLVLAPHLAARDGDPTVRAEAHIGRFISEGWACRILAHRRYAGPSYIGGAQVARVFPAGCTASGAVAPPARRWPGRLSQTIRQIVCPPYPNGDPAPSAAAPVAPAAAPTTPGPLRRALRRLLPTGKLTPQRVIRLFEPPPLREQIGRVRAALRLPRDGGPAERIWRLVGWAVRTVIISGAALLAVVPYGTAYAVILVAGRRPTRDTLSPFARAAIAAIARHDRESADLRVLVPTATLGLLAELLPLPALIGGPLPRLALIFDAAADAGQDRWRPFDERALGDRLRGSGWSESLRCFATDPALAQHLSTTLGITVVPIGGPAATDACQSVAEWLLAATPRARPARPILYVRPSWLASGSATVFDQHLGHLARRGIPTIETVIEPGCMPAARQAAWRDLLIDRDVSASPLTCLSTPRSGLPGIVTAGRFFLRARRASYARQLAEASRQCPLPEPVWRVAADRGFSAIVVNHFFHEPFIGPLHGQAPLWIETHDVQARQMVIRRARNLVTGALDPYEWLIADELSYLTDADIVGAINVEEAAFFRGQLGAGGDRVVLCQPAVVLPPARESVPPCDVLIVASDNPTNVMNLRWFITEVLPRLPVPAPDIRVVGTIGRIADAEGLRAAPIAYTGPVRDLAAHYAAAEIVALPVVAGAGIAIKGLEALAAGRPLVGTPLSFRGLPPEFAPPCALTEDAGQFARALADLLASPEARARAAAATRAAQRSLGMERRFREQMDAVLARLAAIATRPRS